MNNDQTKAVARGLRGFGAALLLILAALTLIAWLYSGADPYLHDTYIVVPSAWPGTLLFVGTTALLAGLAIGRRVP